MLDELRSALHRALNASLDGAADGPGEGDAAGASAELTDLQDVLRRLRAGGFGLIIVVDQRDGASAADAGAGTAEAVRRPRPGASPPGSPTGPAGTTGPIDLTGRLRLIKAGSPAGQRHRAAAPEGAPGTDGEPTFRIDGADLAFLRSIGIDPTRKVRVRKPRPRGAS